MLRWLWYALGGSLPARHREWVLHDATRPTWQLRHFARACVQLGLITVPVLLLVSGPLWVRAVATLLGWLVGLQYVLYTADGSVEYRVQRAGYPPGLAKRIRDDATADERAAAAARYARRYRT
ncbi:hypothetical protein PSU4_34880 [Pseudonocardia sulfidoxydans NBRC 16205]|uniref:DUF5313 domain-containing protein n=1 Tax=Pseudonocardia sulfidoxydans NBRC 16205 TaxID=1223511 RepID=A0A511DL72_9PSEU|nr:hypothetical protein PSU4_34880 [Pseudonocardia sulfidoxydans NBRC 16205]